MTRGSYRYTAASSRGRISRGTVRAAAANDALAAIEAMGLVPVHVSAARSWAGPRRASPRQLAMLFEGLASLVEAGVPMDTALGAAGHVVTGRLREDIAACREAVRSGRTLSDAFTSGEVPLPPSVVRTMRSGEASGQLAAALRQLAGTLARDAERRARTRQALAYPALLLLTGGSAALVMLFVVLPRFATLISDLGSELPPLAAVLFRISEALVAHALPIVTGALACVLAVIAAYRGGRWTDPFHALLLRLPVVGKVRHAQATAAACTAMGRALAIGMSPVTAFDAAREACGDRDVARRLHRASADVINGHAIASALTRHAVLTAPALQLVTIGDGSGRLAELMEQAGILADRDAERALATLTTLLEPFLVLVFGTALMVIASGLLSAVYSIRP